jgi:DNA-binding response OmpR family regulator
MHVDGSILVVDDEVNLRNTMVRILKSAGWQVTSASNGTEALQLIATNSFDLVFLDLRLPDMHGLEILQTIRTQNPKLQVIVLTGHGSMDSAVEAMHLEAADYLLKPIDPEKLVTRTRSLLETLWVERRKREIQDQIASLQSELLRLENELKTDAPISAPENEKDGRYIKLGGFVLDLQSRRTTLNGAAVDIPPASFDYLIVLIRHSPQVVRYQTLVLEAQGYHAELTEARELAKWHVHVLRQAIEPESRNSRYILNVRGVGYQMVVD